MVPRDGEQEPLAVLFRVFEIFHLFRKNQVGRQGLGAGRGRVLTLFLVWCNAVVQNSLGRMSPCYSVLDTGVWRGGPLFLSPPGRRHDLLGWGGLHLRLLRPVAWPGLAWPGRLVFLTNGASQPHALPIPSHPPVLSPGPGSLQVRLRSGTAHSAGRRSPGLRFHGARASDSLCGCGGLEDPPGWGCQPARPAALPPGHCWGAESPRGLWAAQLEPAGREGGGREVKKVHLGKKREEERESKRGAHPGSPETPRKKIFPSAEAK